MLTFDGRAIVFEPDIVEACHVEGVVEVDTNVFKADIMDESRVCVPLSIRLLDMNRVALRTRSITR